jgi:hypothetical protein
MVIQVKDPVKEHEGSKDQFVSYAVRTHVRSVGLDLRSVLMIDQHSELLCTAHRGPETIPGL